MKKQLIVSLAMFVLIWASVSLVHAGEFFGLIIRCSPTLIVQDAQLCKAAEIEVEYNEGIHVDVETDCKTLDEFVSNSNKVECGAAVAAALEAQKYLCSKWVAKKLDIQGYEVVATGNGTQYNLFGKCYD